MSQTKPIGNQKPVLNGAKIKQRKGNQKASEKYEPEVFRDLLFEHLETVKEGTFKVISSKESTPEEKGRAFEAIYTKLDNPGNKLDYKKYGTVLFEILITGGVIKSGTIDHDKQSPVCIFTAEDETSVIQQHVDVIYKLIRRYKYLQIRLEDTLVSILKDLVKWTTEENSKLAKATALFLCNSTLPWPVLKPLSQDNLVKDGLALHFVTDVTRTALAKQSVVQVGRGLYFDLSFSPFEFFPSTKRDQDSFDRHFEAEDMQELVDYFHKVKKESFKIYFGSELSEKMNEDSEEPEEPKDTEAPKVSKSPEAIIIEYIESMMKEGKLTETECVPIIWKSIIGTLDTSARTDQVGAQIVKAVSRWVNVLEHFCTTSKDEIILLDTICADWDVKIQYNNFIKIIKILYAEDILSGAGIKYWNTTRNSVKSKTKISNAFFKELEPFVKWLEAQESDEEDSDEED